MINLSIFSDEEIEEIDTFKELTEAMSVDGEEIICFAILSDIVHKNISVNDISKEQLKIVSSQLSKTNEICSDLVWFDSTMLEEIEPKAQKLVCDIVENKNN
ncbi:hypothetical protein [Clostridium omnivorum]|uniref:Uncharacterized protein n=1 Tax=Clostridium omnivorum TaxID=1604902 RepID=A0ABQ5N701_9CLOT|nr:hypothetical protein [Clostridium sp. E14]GLC30967.1 hypothetical protein bsdE14_23770 [Clostridium sp. E14]